MFQHSPMLGRRSPIYDPNSEEALCQFDKNEKNETSARNISISTIGNIVLSQEDIERREDEDNEIKWSPVIPEQPASSVIKVNIEDMRNGRSIGSMYNYTPRVCSAAATGLLLKKEHEGSENTERALFGGSSPTVGVTHQEDSGVILSEPYSIRGNDMKGVTDPHNNFNYEVGLGFTSDDDLNVKYDTSDDECPTPEYISANDRSILSMTCEMEYIPIDFVDVSSV